MRTRLSSLKKHLPPSLVLALANSRQYITHRSYLGFEKRCPICLAPLRKFIPLSAIADGIFMQTLQIRGHRYTVNNYETLNVEHFLCPICGSQDKARLYALYLKKIFDKLNRQPPKRFRLVHFAPEGGLPELIRRYPWIQYRSADLERQDVDDQADLTALPYRDQYFDAFICSHILEHIPDDKLALHELHRILKPGGWGILMVPIMKKLPRTYQNATITDPEDRLRHFGQRDHVRVYAKPSFLAMIRKSGFHCQQVTAVDFPEVNFNSMGIDPKSVLYVVHK